jgi:hypothetical protein
LKAAVTRSESLSLPVSVSLSEPSVAPLSRRLGSVALDAAGAEAAEGGKADSKAERVLAPPDAAAALLLAEALLVPTLDTPIASEWAPNSRSAARADALPPTPLLPPLAVALPAVLGKEKEGAARRRVAMLVPALTWV